jgi:hypothetical protein
VSEPPTPVPDDKDWTWAIHRPCAECGFDPASVQRAQVPRLVLHYVEPLRAALASARATERPQPTVWSALEYACHVRDVCGLFERRLRLMLSEDDPQFDNWDQDATALAQQYWRQRPATVALELTAAADSISAAFGGVRADQWERPGRRSNGSVFTVDTFARYFLHDVAHHAHDVQSAHDRYDSDTDG